MYRIRFHGRGGQGVKTASRMLGTALFAAGYEVQDAPRYGAERRGAPIFAYVRADWNPINERGVIGRPDLVLVADDSLVSVPSAGVIQGICDDTVVLILTNDSAEVWKERLNTSATIVTLAPPGNDADPRNSRFLGAFCVGAAANLIGHIDETALEAAIRKELAGLPGELVEKNLAYAVRAFNEVSEFKGVVRQGELLSVAQYGNSDWIDLDNEDVAFAAPAIHEGATTVQVRTGLWRTIRPIIEYDLCKRCNWVCSNYCPDNAIKVNEKGYPEIDLFHCKGCMICVAQCPPHAISTMTEADAQALEEAS